MGMVSPLLELCKQAIVPLVQQDAETRRALLSLPSELLGSVLQSFTPVVVQLVHDEIDRSPSRAHSADEVPRGNCSSKRPFSAIVQNSDRILLSCLDAAWKCKFDTRWPSGVKKRHFSMLSSSEMKILNLSDDGVSVGWRQRFWETHLQECLNEAAAQASTPYFQGPLGDINLRDSSMKISGVTFSAEDNPALIPSCPSSCSLKYHCWHFGQYARYLRLCGVLCTEELSKLLSHAKLQHVFYYRVTTAAQVEGLCILLRQNKESLEVVEFQHCKFFQMGISHICNCLILDCGNSRQLRHLFVLSSSCLFQDEQDLSQLRYLRSLVLMDNQLGPSTASKLFTALLKAPSQLSLLHVCENELDSLSIWEASRAACPSNMDEKTVYLPLRSLDLRSNKLNCGDIKAFLPCVELMPFLEHINLSDNPIGDDGLRAVVPCLQSLPVLEFSIASCNISVIGARFLLESLPLWKQRLQSLKLSHNPLGRSIATHLAKFLTHGVVEKLDLGDVGLGLSGCADLQEALAEMPNLTHLVISKNRLGSAGAELLCKFISRASSLEVIDSSCNLLDSKCFGTIALQLQLQAKVGGGVLQVLDLTGNPAFGASEIFENINKTKKPIVLLSNFTENNPLFDFHDDDP